MSKPSYMSDCPHCSAQMWEEVCNKKDNTVKFRCTVEDCQGIISFALSRGINGEDCLICQYNTWNIYERTEDHVMFQCSHCDEICEVWMRSN